MILNHKSCSGEIQVHCSQIIDDLNSLFRVLDHLSSLLQEVEVHPDWEVILILWSNAFWWPCSNHGGICQCWTRTSWLSPSTLRGHRGWVCQCRTRPSWLSLSTLRGHPGWVRKHWGHPGWVRQCCEDPMTADISFKKDRFQVHDRDKSTKYPDPWTMSIPP